MTNSRPFDTTPAPATMRVSLVVALFTITYAVLVFVVGVVPLNLMLRKLFSSGAMVGIWRTSMIRLAERTAVAAAACWMGLAISGRIRGRLTGTGLLALGTVVSGALAGTADVGLQRLWVTHLIRAAQTSPARGIALSSAITAVVAILVTLALITRSTRVVRRQM